LFKIDPDSEKPRWHGEMYHSVSPVHAMLKP
jgi:hypothetical protein